MNWRLSPSVSLDRQRAVETLATLVEKTTNKELCRKMEMNNNYTGNNSMPWRCSGGEDLNSGNIDLSAPARGCLMIFNIFLAIFGNFFIILTYLRNFKMRTTTNTLVVSLCTSDMLSALADTPFWISFLAKESLFSNFAVCQIMLSFEDFFFGGSALKHVWDRTGSIHNAR